MIGSSKYSCDEDEDCARVREYNEGIVREYKNLKKTITTRSVTKQIEGGSVDFTKEIYSKLIEDHPNRELVYNFKQPLTIYWFCNVDVKYPRFTKREIIIPDSFGYRLKKFINHKNKSRRFMLVLVYIIGWECSVSKDMLNKLMEEEVTLHDLQEDIKKESHVNALIIDRKTLTMERFESLGTMQLEKDPYRSDVMDESIQALIETETEKEFTYIKPIDFCPLVGPQKKLDLGYCYIFALYWLDLRIRFPSIDPEELSDIISEKSGLDVTKWKMILDYMILFKFGDITEKYKPKLIEDVREKLKGFTIKLD